ncbi:MAG: GntR family transcriptional regulator [Anaerolineae bacterium]|nr:GntR family transcriptional regulator [Anaerolineae bacterium]
MTVNTPLQRDSGVPLYVQVSEILVQRILNGEWQPGMSLPAEPELCEEFGVARGTLRQALSKLENMGYVRRERGRGTFVANQDERSRSQGLSGNQIAFIVPYVRDSFIPEILLGVERAAGEQNLSVTFKHVENDYRQQAEVLETLADQGLAGVVLYPVDSVHVEPMKRLTYAGFPIVLVDRYLCGVATDYVMSDHFGGAVRATQHLIELGHKSIGFVYWSDPAISMEHRKTGYIQALAEAQITHQPDLVCEVEGYPTVDLDSLRAFLTDHPDLTAVFAANDQIALAVYQAARSLNIRIPHDLALVGFDNLDFTMHLDIPLTTVKQAAFDIGQRAVQTLLTRMKNPSRPPQQVIVPTELIIRRSCGAYLRENHTTVRK